MSFDLLVNSHNLFLKEMYGDQCREFVCGYWGKTNLATATCRSEIIRLVKDWPSHVSILRTFESFPLLEFCFDSFCRSWCLNIQTWLCYSFSFSFTSLPASYFASVSGKELFFPNFHNLQLVVGLFQHGSSPLNKRLNWLNPRCQSAPESLLAA